AKGDAVENIDLNDVPSSDDSLPMNIRATQEKPKVTIYTDPSCPHCASFEQEYSDVLKDYLAEEKITVEYRTVNFMDSSSNGYSTNGGNALLCTAEHSPEYYFDMQPIVISELGPTQSGEDIVNAAND